jgi:hypothetical protein
MKRVILLAGLIAAGIVAAPVHAGILDVSAVIADRSDGANFDYTITLTNSATSTDSLQTFWFSWVPGQDFMTLSPTSVTPPAGWTDIITHGGAADGFAIQFKTATDGLAPGQSLDFSFTSPVTPEQLAGNSPFHTDFPELRAFVYQGQPLQGDSAQFNVTAVPEPSSLIQGAVGVAVCGGFGFLRRRGRRRASTPVGA